MPETAYQSPRAPFKSQRSKETAIYILSGVYVLGAALTTLRELRYIPAHFVNIGLEIFYGIIIVSGLCGLGVVYLAWTYAITKNLDALMEFSDVSPGWAVGYYLVPVVLLYKPYQNMMDVWAKSQPYAQEANLGALVGWWWGAYVVSNTLFYTRVFMLRGHPTSLSGSEITLVVGSRIITLVALGLMLAVVHAINKRQEAKEREIASA